jgi:hypothetical protein
LLYFTHRHILSSFYRSYAGSSRWLAIQGSGAGD